MEKEITIREFYTELKSRIEASKDIECCKDEILRLAALANEEFPDKKIMVHWKEN